jgi:hypothetical protein
MKYLDRFDEAVDVETARGLVVAVVACLHVETPNHTQKKERS